MKTYSAKQEEQLPRWYLVDAKGCTLGRLCTRIANLLRGKGKPIFTPHVDTGDFVVVINAQDIVLTGNKLKTKMYYHHSHYPGGLTTMAYADFLQRFPERVIEKAVWGMMPKTKLGNAIFKKLKVYRGAEHPHTAQQPEPIVL
jgi:large subunit ribosomal protein L13